VLNNKVTKKEMSYQFRLQYYHHHASHTFLPTQPVPPNLLVDMAEKRAARCEFYFHQHPVPSSHVITRRINCRRILVSVLGDFGHSQEDGCGQVNLIMYR